MTNEFTSILEGKNLADLRAIARQMGISGCDKMRKTQIIALITGGEETAQTAPNNEQTITETEEPTDAAETVAASDEPKVKEPKAKATRAAKTKTTKAKAATKAPKEAPDQQAELVDIPEPQENEPQDITDAGAPVETVKTPAKRRTRTKTSKVDKSQEAEMVAPASDVKEPAVEPAAEPEGEISQEAGSADVTEVVEITKTRRAYTRRKTAKQPVQADTEVGEQDAPAEAVVAEPADQTETVQPEPKPEPIPDDDVQGVLEIMADGYGFLRTRNYLSGSDDIYVSPSQIKRFGLRSGDRVTGKARRPSRGDKFRALSYIERLNGDDYATMEKRPRFENLTPIYPDNKLRLETLDANNRSKEITSRLLDIMAPIGRGQRGLIVSPPKAGKTELLKKIAHGITANHPDVHLIVLLIDERPEEVTDMQRSIKGEIVYSTFDEEPEHHVKAAEMVMEHAKRMVEQGKDVVILMDSLTRLTRAYNLTITNSGRTMSGGMDTAALIKPKKFLGAARNIEFGGSLTIIATALVDTGSKMDDLIYEEFKGTGNLEIHLDRKLSERRIFPAIDIYKSGTRRDDLLLSQAEKDAADKIRRAFSSMGIAECTEMVINQMLRTPNNSSFLMTVKV